MLPQQRAASPADVSQSSAHRQASRSDKPCKGADVIAGPASDVEDAIVADAQALTKAQQLLVAAGRKDPTGDEIDATAQLLGEGADSAGIASLAKFAAAGRAIDVPLRVGAELVATTASPKETLARVEDRVRSGATDPQLEALLDGSAVSTRVAAASKGKESRVAKKPAAASVKQAGTPAKSSSTKNKTAGK